MSKKRNRLFLISNMYPSKEDVRYGIFVKRFEEAVNEYFEVKRLVLTKKINVTGKIFGYILVYLKILSLIFRSKDQDIVYVHFPLYFAPVLWLFKWEKVPLVLNFHGSDATFGSTLKKLLKWFLVPVIKRSKKIVVPSAYYLDKVSDIFEIDDHNKIYVYPSGGINAKLFRPKTKKQQGELVYGFVSNFIESKGWRIFLEALYRVCNQNKSQRIKGIMVGDGPDKTQVVKTIQDMRVNVELIGNVPQDQLAEIYAGFSAFIFPTYREEESLGLVGIEAMMCGIPVIGSKVGGPLGYIVEGYNGFLFEKKNIDELVHKMEQFQNLTKSQVDDLVENCVATAKKYDSTLVNKGLLNMLISLNQGL